MDNIETKVLNKVRSGSCFTTTWRNELAGLVNTLLPQEKEMLIVPLAFALQSVNASERANAIHVLRVLGPHTLPLHVKEGLINSLILFLKSDNILKAENTFTERENAVYVLGAFGQLARPAVPAIVQVMNHSCVIKQVIDSLPKIAGDDAVLELAEAIPLVPNHLRYHILDWLADLGPSALTHITPYLAGGLALNVLRKIGPVAIPAILDEVRRANVNDADGQSVCAMAGSVLSSFGSAANQPVLAALESGKSDALPSILKMLAWLRPPAHSMKMVPRICSILVDDANFCSGSCGWYARDALIPLGLSVIPDLCGSFANADRSIYPRLQRILTSFGYSAIPALVESMSHVNTTVQANAAGAILRITAGDEKNAVQQLSSMLSDDDAQIRLIALEALVGVSEKAYPGEIGLQLGPDLMQAWQDPDSVIRRQADEACGEIGTRTNVAVDKLMQSVSCVNIEQRSRTPGELMLPSMPGYCRMKETLERDFPMSMEIGWADNPPKMVMGQIDFEAQHLKDPLSANSIGQPTFFKRHILVQVFIKGYLFKNDGATGSERTCGLYADGAASGRTHPLYAYDGARLMDIDGSGDKANVAEILRAEAIGVDQIDPVELAWFFCHLLLPRFRLGFGMALHLVVEPSDGCEKESIVTSPSVTATENHGWTVHFWTLYHQGGCSPTIPLLCEHTVRISPNFDITYEQS